MTWFGKNIRQSEVDKAVARLEQKDALVSFTTGSVSVSVFEKIDGRRVRRAEGTGINLLGAILDVESILQEQDAPSSS